MASNTITVVPRKKTTQDVVEPQRRTAVQYPITTGTVLLQTPLPKYTFNQKQKKKSNKQTTVTETQATLESNTSQSIHEGPGIGKMSTEAKKTQSATTMSKENTDLGFGATTENGSQIQVTTREKPVNKVGPISSSLSAAPRSSQSLDKSVSLTSTGAVCVTDITPAVTALSLSQSPTVQQNANAHHLTHASLSEGNLSELATNTSTQSEPVSVESSSEREGNQAVASKPSMSDLEDKVRHLEEEKQLLRNQLDVQLQVNQELKKLLVASVGEDLQHRVERLTRDRALMSVEIGDYSKKLVEDYEHLDKISIQADMWRSKYLACRVMSDELASSRAFYSMQFKECQMALQQLLSERHELRMNLYESYRGLQLIQEAFDPLKSHSSLSHSQTSKNILDLARTNQHLVDSIKYRLLPSHVTSTMNKKLEVDWNDYLTPAEAHARQLMSREMRPEDFSHMATPLPPGAMAVDRYHPFANFDNLTFNVCKKCKGDISVV